MAQLYNNFDTTMLTVSSTSELSIWLNMVSRTADYNCFTVACQGVNNDMATLTTVEILITDTTVAPSTSTFGSVLQTGDVLQQENINPYNVWVRTSVQSATVFMQEYFKGD